MMTGGGKLLQDANMQGYCDRFRDVVENEHLNGPAKDFQMVSYTTNARQSDGSSYYIKINTGNGFVRLNVFEPWAGLPELKGVLTGAEAAGDPQQF